MAELKLISMRDIKAEEVSWLWKPYIPLGKITIVQGDPGEGKTTLMLAIAAAVTAGKPIADSVATSPVNVIFQTAEDGLADTIKPRLEKFGANFGRVDVIDEEEASLSLSDERIEQAIVKMDAKLFIIDPLQAYVGDADMHRASAIRPLMKSLARVAERTGCAVVIIGHLNKSGSKSAYRGLGSIDIYAAARSVLTVGKMPDDENIRAVVQGKSNLAPPGTPLAFGLDGDGKFCWLGECDVTINELLSGKSSEKDDSRLGQTMGFVKNELAVGLVSAADMLQKATENGIPKVTLDRAKQTLGVKSVKHGKQLFWSMEDIQDTHTNSLNILPAGTEG